MLSSRSSLMLRERQPVTKNNFLNTVRGTLIWAWVALGFFSVCAVGSAILGAKLSDAERDYVAFDAARKASIAKDATARDGLGETIPAKPSATDDFLKTAAECVKALSEAFAASFLVYILIDFQLKLSEPQQKVFRAIENIRTSRGGERIVEALIRDFARGTHLIKKAEFEIRVDLENCLSVVRDGIECRILVYKVRIKETVEIVYADKESRHEATTTSIEAQTGHPESWLLNTLTIEYQADKRGDFIVVKDGKLECEDKFIVSKTEKDGIINTVVYNLDRDIDNLRQEERHFARVAVRSKNFVNGIMENYVFKAPAKNVTIKMSVDKRIKASGSKFPLKIWIAPDEQFVNGVHEGPNKNSYAGIWLEGDVHYNNYKYCPDRQFLPLQGFSIVLEQPVLL